MDSKCLFSHIMHVFNCLLNMYYCSRLSANFPAIRTDLRAVSMVTYFEKSTLMTGETDIVPGTEPYLAITLSFCIVELSRTLLLCIEKC